MDLVSKYHEYIKNKENNGHEFYLFKYTECLYLGEDNRGNVVIICLSDKPNRSPLRQKTKMLSIECNMKVQYVLDGILEKQTVHIIRCYASTDFEKDIFVELAPLFEEASKRNDQEEALLETVSVLSSFFANKVEPSDIELQGLFAELLTIKKYQEVLQLGDYWQTKDRLKFDFSINNKLKIEVKSTTKNERKHHFRHEQLSCDLFDIYVVSYMLRHDDEGLSLYELIQFTKPIINTDPRRLLILNRYLKNTSELRLKQCRFNEELAYNKMLIFNACDIPKVEEELPETVTNTEYDCNLSSVVPVEETSFVEHIKSFQS